MGDVVAMRKEFERLAPTAGLAAGDAGARRKVHHALVLVRFNIVSELITS